MLLLKNVPIPSSFRFDGFRAGIPSGLGSLSGISGKCSEFSSSGSRCSEGIENREDIGNFGFG